MAGRGDLFEGLAIWQEAMQDSAIIRYIRYKRSDDCREVTAKENLFMCRYIVQ